MSSSPANKRPPRTSSRGGRGRGRGSRRGGGGRGNARRNNSSNKSIRETTREDESDEDVLIAFMPYMRSGNEEALQIHEKYSHNQKLFVIQVRQFLKRHENNNTFSNDNNEISSARSASQEEEVPTKFSVSLPPEEPAVASPNGQPPPQQISSFDKTPSASPHPGKTPFTTPTTYTPTAVVPTFTEGELHDRMDRLAVKEDPIFETRKSSSPPPPPFSQAPGSIKTPPPAHGVSSRSTTTPIGVSPMSGPRTTPLTTPPPSFATTSTPISSPMPPLPISMPTLSPGFQVTPEANPLSGFETTRTPNALPPPDLASVLQSNSGNWAPAATERQAPSQQKANAAGETQHQATLNFPTLGGFNITQPGPPGLASLLQPGTLTPSLQTPTVAEQPKVKPEPAVPPPPQVEKNEEETSTVQEEKAPPETPAKPKKEWQPRRLWTRLDEQPGRLVANNNWSAVSKQVFIVRPRQELTAKWMLPLSYIRSRHDSSDNVSLRDALESLAVGLFRQGCTENGTNASIITKQILTEDERQRKDYPVEMDSRTDIIWGTVPFYSPRTPGNVVFRLYWEDEPLHTLATGPTLSVTVSNNSDVEPTLRFILGNFKTKNKNATSLSSIHSLAAVLEQFQPSQQQQQPRNTNFRVWEGASRAAWGCICESKKVLEACAVDYIKAKEKHAKLEAEVDKLQAEVDELPEDEKDMDENGAELTEKLREKKRTLMSGRAINERRWKDSQVAYSSLLHVIVTNPSCSLLYKRDLLSEVRLELELWCNLCESFAPSPFRLSDNDDQASKIDALRVNSRLLPRPITSEHFRLCTESRAQMQKRILGFVPNTTSIQDVLMPPVKPAHNSHHQKSQSIPQLDSAAVQVVNNISSSMCQLYQDVYLTSDSIHEGREMVRAQIENLVSRCDAFPTGTKVVIFGSAANGFGSPSSDLDMCLQLPSNSHLENEEDKTGAIAMAELAELFEAAGVQNVDTCRLTARIPVIKFDFRKPNNDDVLLECDLSMQNPLACLNTSLLKAYSRINPVTTIVASIVKRWAKHRDINDPSRHTLSSYGYILMLLHFLTFHKSTGNGLVTPLTTRPRESEPDRLPLLPNLFWMDPTWPNSPPGTPYKELSALPKNLKPHPLEKNFVVNTYYYHLSDRDALANLQHLFPGQDLNVAIILASFFRYYAYEFDYRKHVVSLHSTASRNKVTRDEKAETDAWKSHSHGLAIEDPFERFYDVAHVVKGIGFHTLRKEMALAYTKIVNVASRNYGKDDDEDVSSMTGMELLDWICKPFEKTDDSHARD